MRPTTLHNLLLSVLVLLPAAAPAAQSDRFGLSVLLDGRPRPEYAGNGTTYVEAVRGREYTLRITNPLPYRVAVALAVDGLNTIDARHTSPAAAAKWVLEPYESVEIPGWQVNGEEARAFFFTGERSSYGAWLGQTDDLGVIEAAFYREVRRPIAYSQPTARALGESRRERGADGAPAPPAAAGAGAESMDASPTGKAAPQLADEYAATGIGDRSRHEVTRVALDLEKQPAAVVRIRYEFRPQLVKLGLLPPTPRWPPLERREHARGFAGSYCPEPD